MNNTTVCHDITYDVVQSLCIIYMLFAKGLNFSLPPKYLDYGNYLVNFELFYRNICNFGILSKEDLYFVKTRTKEAAFPLIEAIITTDLLSLPHLAGDTCIWP